MALLLALLYSAVFMITGGAAMMDFTWGKVLFPCALVGFFFIPWGKIPFGFKIKKADATKV